MIRVNIVDTKKGKDNVIKTLHFEDTELEVARRWARDMVRYLAVGGYRCIATLHECKEKNTPSIKQLETIRDKGVW